MALAPLSLVSPELAQPDLSVIPPAPLMSLFEDERFRLLDKQESYFRKTQDNLKKYDWDGNITPYGSEAAINPGWYVPHSARRPSSRYDVASLIVSSLSAMMFGQDKFPDIRVEGDDDAEDYVSTLAKEARLATRMQEARDLGGATGTAVLSFGFVKGKPRVKVHNSKHCTVLRWADEDELRPGAVMEGYSYQRRVYNTETKKMEAQRFWRVRFWDEVSEITWKDIPDKVAAEPIWQRWPKKTINVHDYGFCPVYWIQNRPCSSEYDGEGDYEGLEGTLDQINRLTSATTKGTTANVDPTLVVHADPSTNTGQVKKGSENAIFSEKGAEYLELKGTAIAAAKENRQDLIDGCLAVAGVILPDPKDLAGAAQSAKALEILYQPMLARCDVLREQYGEHGVKPILRDMLEVARKLLLQPPVETEDGEVVTYAITLPPRVEREAAAEPGGEPTVTTTPRNPGTSSEVMLNWRPYFSPTWKDVLDGTTALKNANGGKAMVSQLTAVKAVGTMLGVEDAEAELALIQEEEQTAMAQQQAVFESQLAAESQLAPGPKKPGE